MNKTIMKQLKILALSGSHPKVWVASALVYKNKVVSYGVNQMKSHPFQLKYGRNDKAIFFHAETSAIYNAEKLGFDKFKKSSLYIARVKWNSSEKDVLVSGISFPCEGCYRCISDFKIKNVIYTLDHVEHANEHYGVLML